MGPKSSRMFVWGTGDDSEVIQGCVKIKFRGLAD
jgi:hypothetical protein